MTRPRFIVLIAALGLFVPSYQASGQDLRRIMYGTTASPSNLPLWVAKDAGYFDKYRFNVEPVQVRGGSLITLAIITGDLPFSGVGAESVIAARAAGGRWTFPAARTRRVTASAARAGFEVPKRAWCRASKRRRRPPSPFPPPLPSTGTVIS